MVFVVLIRKSSSDVVVQFYGTSKNMIRLLTIFGFFMMSSCASYLAVETSTDDNVYNDIDIVEAVAVDIKLGTSLVEVISDELNGENKSYFELKHKGGQDVSCREGLDEKVCSAEKGCWCQSLLK